ncbi:MAG: ATP-binding protein [Pseudomonadota bacterium]
MKQIAVISGKGGTGKTIIAASFACLAGKKVLIDCDVDASNLHILLRPETVRQSEFSGSQIAVIHNDTCLPCGLCESYCRFGAIVDSQIDPMSCEGCGVCFHTCPERAITMEEKVDGIWFVSETKYGPFVHARLGAGRPNSGKLVSLLKREAADIARNGDFDYIVVDGPPGIGCPFISTLSGVDVALVVTEPTLSGLHDLERAVKTADHFDVKSVVCINKHDLNERMSREIEATCGKQGIPVIGKISFSEAVQDAVNHCLPVLEYSSNGPAKEITMLWDNLVDYLNADI